MLNIPGEPPITLTDKAKLQIKKLAKKNRKAILRIGLKKGGCAGMEYTMDFIDSIGPHDEVISYDGAKVVIAPNAQMFLLGTQIDYETNILESGFKFNNPNVSEACGCGESIKFNKT